MKNFKFKVEHLPEVRSLLEKYAVDYPSVDIKDKLFEKNEIYISRLVKGEHSHLLLVVDVMGMLTLWEPFESDKDNVEWTTLEEVEKHILETQEKWNKWPN